MKKQLKPKELSLESFRLYGSFADMLKPSGKTTGKGPILFYRDMVQLVVRSIETPVTGFTVAYGVSANTRAPVSNHKVGFLGYKPQDNAEDWAEALFAKAIEPNPQDLAQSRLGGPFASVKLGESGIAGIQAMTAGKKA